MALTDDIARLTFVSINQHIASGQMAALRLRSRLTLDQLGKACGVSGSVVQSWMNGTSTPTTAQGLALLDTLYRSTGPDDPNPAA